MTVASNQSSETEMIMTAVAIVPGPDGTLTFVLQNCGAYIGHWLLPGGYIDPGETPEQAARREAAEEAGVDAGALAPCGVYDLYGRFKDEPYAFRLHVYRASEPSVVREGFAFDPEEISGICQARPDEILPHPTDMRILNDVGLADYDEELIDKLLDTDEVTMIRRPDLQVP
ncbi:NUDIX hydrolase [Marinactinospora thermotolerans]|uniref:8-oxo-dGTP diphosphatase n=1 Tax=Marinactinospora thermotolerans DSM 45154 TaxID=1122192 RepID=A0A1T4RAD5_9ACTN|nr:NUDIX domain-containing protein [Marinactinospora thermotolerans]SKA12982.1 8-oxo-dGTP diphosphatase [Marinactinospora thermotolerans DSM 45154]